MSYLTEAPHLSENEELRAIKKLIYSEIKVLEYYANSVLHFPHNLGLNSLIDTLRKTQGLQRVNGELTSMSLEEYHIWLDSITTVMYKSPNELMEY